jgi:hypothetical protein
MSSIFYAIFDFFEDLLSKIKYGNKKSGYNKAAYRNA